MSEEQRLNNSQSPISNLQSLISRLQSLIPNLQSPISSLLLLLLPWLLLWRLWAPNPADRHVFAYGDFVEQFYPLRLFAANEIKAGRLPLWNPHIYGGTPALADPQWATLYPPTWLSALVPPWPPLPFEVLQAEAVLHLGLAGVFTYLFARRHLPWAGAFLAAVVFSLGGYLTSYPPLQLAVLETAVWLPAVLLGVDRLTDSAARPGRAVALAALTLALALLAGHPQTFLLILYTAVAYTIVRLWRRVTLSGAKSPASIGRTSTSLHRKFLPPLLWLLGAAGLSAAQWWPTLELARLGPRLVLPYTEAGAGFTWPELAHILLPGAFGPWSPLYVGAATLFLAGVAVWSRRHVGFWTRLAVVGLLLSLGASGGLYWLAYHLAPGFNLFRHWERAALLWSFALAMLAGHGLAYLTRRGEGASLPSPSGRGGGGEGSGLSDWDEDPHPNPLPLGEGIGLRLQLPALLMLALALALLVVWTARGQPGSSRLALWTSLAMYSTVTLGAAGLIGPRVGKRLWLVALLLLVGLDLFSTSGRGLTQSPPPGGYLVSNSIVWTVQADHDGLFRVSSEGLLPPGGGNGAVIWDVEDVVGNSPLHLAAHDRLIEEAPELVWWRLLGVRYIVSKRVLSHGALAELDRVGEARLYRLAGSLPRAWVVPAVRLVPDDDAVFAALADPAFDPATVAVSADPAAAALGLPTTGEPLTRSTTDILVQTPTHITVQVDTPAPGLLVYGEASAPGWRAWVNSQPAPVVPVDGLLRAAPVPAGMSTVEWRYQPVSVFGGILISVLTALALAALAWRWR